MHLGCFSWQNMTAMFRTTKLLDWSTIKTYRTAMRTACLTRETEIDSLEDTAILVI